MFFLGKRFLLVGIYNKKIQGVIFSMVFDLQGLCGANMWFKVFANMSQTVGEKNPMVSIELGETTWALKKQANCCCIWGLYYPIYLVILYSTIIRTPDPYSPLSIMESRDVFFRGSHVDGRNVGSMLPRNLRSVVRFFMPTIKKMGELHIKSKIYSLSRESLSSKICSLYLFNKGSFWELRYLRTTFITQDGPSQGHTDS